jgi:hypothetical protein
VIAGTTNQGVERLNILESLNRRLEVLGAYLNDKQYLLGIRRAAMQLSRSVSIYVINYSILTLIASNSPRVTLLLPG